MVLPARRSATRRIAVTFRIRSETAAMLRARAKARGLSQTAFVEEAIEREWRADRRRLAQEAALLDASENERLAEGTLEVAGEVFGEPE